VTLEESAQGITGWSWFTPSLAPATAMKFAWEMDAAFSNTRTANR
jgi:nitric oxide synthase oxygenase domain/subunit